MNLHGRVLGRRQVLALGTSATAAGWLAACGAGNSTRTREAKSPSAVQATQAAPRGGGVLHVRGTATPALDPHASSNLTTQRLAGAVYSRLLRFRAGADAAVSADCLVEPDQAAAWEQPPDGVQVTLRLRANARWHAIAPVSGRAVDAEDVRFSFDRFRAQQKNPTSNAFGSAANPIVERVETPDAHTVVLHLARPYAPLLSLLASPQHLWLLPREADKDFDPARTVIGSGPFILDVLEPDVRILLRRNPDYFLGGRPYIDALERVLFKDDVQERAQFAAGRLELASVAPEAKPEMERTAPGAQFVPFVPPIFTFLSPQIRGNAPLRDERVRRALSLAIDRKGWLDLMYPGTRGRYQNFVPASLGRWWLDPQSPGMGEAAKWFRYDPRKARAILSAAGMEDLPLRFIYPRNGYGEKFRQGAEATIGMLREAGFAVEPVAQDYVKEYIAPGGTLSGNYDGVFYGLQAAYTDPHDYLYGMNHSASRRNHAGVNDPEADRLIDQQSQTLNEAERVARVHDVQRYLGGKLYYIPLAVGETFVAVQPWVKDYRMVSTTAAATESYSELWLERT